MTRTTWILSLALGAWAATGCSAKSGTSEAGGHGADASLSALVVTADTEEAPLSPAFAPDVHTYTTAVRSRATSLTVTATATDPRVRSISVQPLGGAAVPLTSGVATAVALPAIGATMQLRVVVTAQDGVSTSGYTVNLTRRALGSDAALASLTDNEGILVFAAGTTSYAYEVPEVLAAGYSLTPTLSDPFASMTVNGAAAQSGAGWAVDFSSGSATVTIVVTAEDGVTQTTYTVHLSLNQVIPPTGVSVSSAGGKTVLGAAGDTLQLTAAVAPSNAVQAVNWSSSDPTIATVSSGGLVTAVGSGEVTVTASVAGATGITASIALVSGGGRAYFVLAPGVQGKGAPTATASLSSGTLTVTHSYGASGNAFKYDGTTGFLYGSNSNGFVILPFPLRGDFTLSATVAITAQAKNNNASGVGLGVTTGTQSNDRYAYVFMPASTTALTPTTPTATAAASTKYVNSPTNVTTGTTALAAATYSVGAGATSVQLTFSRIGSTYTLGAGAVTTTFDASALTDGTTAYGPGTVFPTLAFNNVNATISSLVFRDGAGNAIWDSATGTLTTWVPPSLTLSASTATIVRNKDATVNATAVAGGGAKSGITAVAADPSVVAVDYKDGVMTDNSPSVITLTGLKVGSTTVTVTNTADTNAGSRTKTIAVTVEDFTSSDGYGSLATRAYPAPGATAAYTDGELSLTFDSKPTLNAGGTISIFSYPDGTLVDRILFAGEVQPVTSYAGTSPTTVNINVGAQLARVEGNTVYFTPHFGKLAYGGSYYVGIATTAITGQLNATSFSGLSNLPSVATWRFTTRSAPTLGTTVNVDGSPAQTTADFRTLGGALMALAANPVASATAVTVNVAAGTYTELVNYRAKANSGLTITIRGPAGNARGDSAIVQYANGNGMNPSTSTRPSFYFAGANLVLENLWFKNTATRAAVNQAETLYFDSRTGYTVAAHNCSFSSNQDTLQLSGRAWFYDDYVEGNVDFLWGTADVALFEGCDVHVIPDASASTQQTYSLFVARTAKTAATTVGKGFVLWKSRVTVSDGVTAAYGRDAGYDPGNGGFYDQVTLIGNTFSTPSTGVLATGLWVNGTAPLSLGDSSYVGWKSSGNTGLTADQSPVSGTLTIASQTSEYDTRDHILNRDVTVASGAPTGFAAAATTLATTGLATAWGAPTP